jgi:alpha-beta hydrolase superfamily lysophospholipase
MMSHKFFYSEANAPVRGVIQIVQNISEDILRYQEFAEFMAKQGFVVCGNEHLDVGNHKILAKDICNLTARVKQEFKAPVILLGIGTGSLIARYICAARNMEYHGAAFCGTPSNFLRYIFGHKSTARRDLRRLYRIVNSKTWPGRIAKDMPIFLFSGQNDPMGNYGRGVSKVYGNLLNAGCTNVDITLYPDARHEILLEPNRQAVYEDFLNWINVIMEGL